MTASENLEGELDDPRGKADRLREWRREKVWEYRSMGLTIDEIVDVLKAKPEVQISHGTVSRDLKAKEKEINKEFGEYIKNLPARHNLAMTRVQRVIKESWRMYAKDENRAKEILPIILRATEIEQQLLGDPAQIERALSMTTQLHETATKERSEVAN